MTISRTWTGNPLVIGKHSAIQVTYITGTEVYGELRWFKYTVAWLRFRYKREKKNNAYENELFQGRNHFTL